MLKIEQYRDKHRRNVFTWIAVAILGAVLIVVSLLITPEPSLMTILAGVVLIVSLLAAKNYAGRAGQLNAMIKDEDPIAHWQLYSDEYPWLDGDFEVLLTENAIYAHEEMFPFESKVCRLQMIRESENENGGTSLDFIFFLPKKKNPGQQRIAVELPIPAGEESKVDEISERILAVTN